MERDGPVDTPEFYAEILQDFMDEVVEEAEQTTLSLEEKPGLKTGSKEAKEAADLRHESIGEALAIDLQGLNLNGHRNFFFHSLILPPQV